MIDNSYYIILNRLKAFANGHYLINTFTYHEIANFDITKNPHYPIMHAVPVSMNPTKGAIDYSFNITFADWVRAKEDKQENEVTVISDMHRCALDLCAEITNGNILFGDEVTINGDATIEPFIDEFANVLSGVTLQITIRIPYDWSACDIPANWVDGTGDIPDFGGRSLTMDIYDEGNFIVAAREMNFVGSGVTVTYTGNRAIVTINGGSGGGSVDGVTGNIVNNTDPANPVVTQVQPDWNASSGLGQILNKPTIPSAQVNSDWDATSGVAEILNKPSSLPPSGDAGGDLTGSYPNPTVSKIHGIDVQNGTASDGQILKYHSAENKWKHHTQVKADVGLGNVDNTSDLNKPISTATQTALDLKKNKSEQRIFETTSNFNSSSTTRADVTELTVSMVAGKKYKLDLFAAMQSGTTTTGCSIGFYISAGTATINGIARGLISTGASATALDAFINTLTTTAGAAGSFFTTTGVAAVNTPHGIGGSFYVEVSSDCDFKFQFGSEVNASQTTLLSGSAIIVDQLN